MRSEIDKDRPLTRTQAARRDDIIRAAIIVLNRDGAAQASVEKIAQQAGTSKGTVLYHFASKEAIFDDVVAALYEHGATYMTERIAAAPDARGRLRAYLDSNLHFIAQQAAHVNAIHLIFQHRPPASQPPSGIPELAALLSAGQDSGEFGAFDPVVVAAVIRAMVDAASFQFAAHPERDVDHDIDQIIALFDRATAVQPQR